jgi:hypothetical protein
MFESQTQGDQSTERKSANPTRRSETAKAVATLRHEINSVPLTAQRRLDQDTNHDHLHKKTDRPATGSAAQQRAARRASP